MDNLIFIPSGIAVGILVVLFTFMFICLGGWFRADNELLKIAKENSKLREKIFGLNDCSLKLQAKINRLGIMKTLQDFDKETDGKHFKEHK